MNDSIKKIIGAYFNAITPIFPKMARKQSIALMSRVQAVPISEEGQVFFDEGENTTLNIGTEKAVLHKWGNGPTNILFLHGWMSHSQRWRSYVAELDLSEFTVYALDAPGHGASEGKKLNLEIYRKSVEAALQHIGKVKTLVCHSFGNLATAYQYLLKNGLPVEEFVMMGAPSGMDAIFDYFQSVLGLSKKAIENLKIEVDALLKLPHEELMMENFFKKVEKFVLVIHEKTDRITPFQPIEKAVKTNENIKSLYTSGLDHKLNSDEVKNAVLAVIK